MKKLFLALFIFCLFANNTASAYPEHIAAHYQAWYREPRFSSNDSWIKNNYEYNWTLRQHGSEETVKYFDADKTSNGQGEIAGYQYPLTNFYDSRDDDLQKYHAALMKIAGIDTVIFDFYGAVDVKDYQNPRVNSDSFIKNVLDPAEMKYLVFYEEFSAVAQDYSQTEAVSQAEAEDRIKQSLQWLQDNWFNRKGYVKYNGRPIVMVFANHAVFSTREQWEYLAAQVGINPLPLFVNQGVAWEDYEAIFNWIPVDADFDTPAQRKILTGSERHTKIQTEFEWYANHTPNKIYFIATAYPGFDDSVFDELNRFGENNSHNAINFDDGETFKQAFDLALSVNPNMIQLATWNDYNEDTVIEPTTSSLCHNKTEAERGYKSLEHVQARTNEWQNVGWTAQDLRAPLELYKLAKSLAAGDPETTASQKQIINEAYNAIFENNAAEFRRIASSIIIYDNSVKPILRAEILTSEINEALTGTSYSQNLEATGTAPIFWRAENLPTGLICSQSGQISGNPSVSGNFNVTVTAENSAGSVSKIFNMIASNNNATGNGENEGETDNSTQNIEGQAEENKAENDNQQLTGNQTESHDISNAPQNNNNTGSGSNSGGCESFNLRPLWLFFIIKHLGRDNKKFIF